MLWYQQSSQVKKKVTDKYTTKRQTAVTHFWLSVLSKFLCLSMFLSLSLSLFVSLFTCCVFLCMPPTPSYTLSHTPCTNTHLPAFTGKRFWPDAFVFLLLWGFLSLFDHTATTNERGRKHRGLKDSGKSEPTVLRERQMADGFTEWWTVDEFSARVAECWQSGFVFTCYSALISSRRLFHTLTYFHQLCWSSQLFFM